MNHKDNNNLACNDFEFIAREIWARLNKNKILNYLNNNGDAQIETIHSYLKNNSISVFPYSYSKNYSLNNVEIQKDKDSGLLYILRPDNKKLFLKDKYKSFYRGKRYYNNLLMEQDIHSPHRYYSDGFIPDKDSVIIDIGGAEGIFALDYIDTVKKVYIFECDPGWIKALRYTYAKWSDKVEIIDKMVLDYNDESHISLDSFVSNYNLLNEHLFIKIDAEASERKILDGAKDIINNSASCTMLVCSYHKEDDEKEIISRLPDWTIEASDGYMLYYYDFDIKAPYLRHGLLRCKKKA